MTPTFLDLLSATYAPMDETDLDAFAGVEGRGFVCYDPPNHPDWVFIQDHTSDTVYLQAFHHNSNDWIAYEVTADTPQPKDPHHG